MKTKDIIRELGVLYDTVFELAVIVRSEIPMSRKEVRAHIVNNIMSIALMHSVLLMFEHSEEMGQHGIERIKKLTADAGLELPEDVLGSLQVLLDKAKQRDNEEFKGEVEKAVNKVTDTGGET